MYLPHYDKVCESDYTYDPKNLYFSEMHYGYKERIIWCWIRIRWKSCKKTRAKKVTSEEVTEK